MLIDQINLDDPDDHLIIALDDEAADHMCNQLPAIYRAWDLQINFSKTQYLTSDPDGLFTDGVEIRKVD